MVKTMALDPQLTHSLPPAPTLYGGLDVLAQAIGAIAAVTNTPVAGALAFEALALVREALPAVVADGADAGARNRMACASLLAGCAMNLSEVGSDHSLGHAPGVRHGIPHRLSVGLVLAEAMERDRHAAPERIADALGAPPAAVPDGSRAVAAVRALLADVGPLAEVAQRAWIPVAPRPWSRDDVEQAYRRALALRRRTSEEPHAARLA